MLEEQIVFSRLNGSDSVVWSFRLAAGYLKVLGTRSVGFGRYDIMLTPADREKDYAYIVEFKVHKSQREKDLKETLENALSQIEEKRYEATLLSKRIAPGRIKKYGFAFKGKECLIG